MSTLDPPAPVVQVSRRTIDAVIVLVGVVIAVVMVVAGSLLTWGSNFSNDYVHDELASQHVVFSDAASLTKEGRDDLVEYAGQPVDNGKRAEAYASYINQHLESIGGGKTYADLGVPERAAKAAVAAAVEAGSADADVAKLKAEAAGLTAQRDSMFKGETLRGLLLSAYAWSIIGRIAGIAATAAFITAGLLALLVIAGLVHLRRVRRAVL